MNSREKIIAILNEAGINFKRIGYDIEDENMLIAIVWRDEMGINALTEYLEDLGVLNDYNYSYIPNSNAIVCRLRVPPEKQKYIVVSGCSVEEFKHIAEKATSHNDVTDAIQSRGWLYYEFEVEK